MRDIIPEYSRNLADVIKSARCRLGLTQKQVIDALNIDDRTLSNIECNKGNPKLEILYPLVRFLEIDGREIFHPEMKRDTPALRHLRVLVENCTEEEAEALIPVFYSIYNVFRGKCTSSLK